MTKFRLIIKNYNQIEVFQSIKEFINVRIGGISIQDEFLSLCSIFKNVQDLQITNVTVNQENFVKLINNCPHLKQLIVSECNVIPLEAKTTIRKTIDNLILVLDDQERHYFDIFFRMNFQSKSIFFDLSRCSKRYHSLGNFLAIQKNLKVLGIKMYYVDYASDPKINLFKELVEFNIRKIEQFSFQLLCRCFTINNNLGMHMQRLTNLLTFLENNKDSLIVLDIQNCSLSHQFFETLYKLKLTKLIIEAKSFESPEIVKANDFLKELVIRQDYDNFSRHKFLLTIYRKIEVLTLLNSIVTNETLLQVRDNLKRIRKLSCGVIYLRTIAPIKIPSLTTIATDVTIAPHIPPSEYHFLNVNQIQTLLLRNSGAYNQLGHNTIHEITHNIETLEELIITNHQIQVDEQMTTILKRNCPNISAIRMTKNDEEEMERIYNFEQNYEKIYIKLIHKEIEQKLITKCYLIEWWKIEFTWPDHYHHNLN